jgi:DNA-binding SARP family transcriptional activator/tetratricopeptide (TPR) repeat protein
MPAGAEFCLLGPLAVRNEGVAVSIPQRRQRALLAVLLLHPGRAWPAARLAELLWAPAEPPSSGEATVRNYVKRLRRALGTVGLDRIVTVPGGYLIRVEPGELDITVMEQALAAAHEAARRDDWRHADLHAGTALLLWRGAPLADIDLPELAAAEAARLAELRLQAQELRAEAGLRVGRHAEMVTELRQLAAASPLRERLHGLLMLALYRSGRRAEAMATYQVARDILVTQLGSEPGPELQALHRQVLTDDPALAAPAPPSGDRAGTPGETGAPRQLPAAVADFTGRAFELAALTKMLDRHLGSGAPAMVISAIGGTAGVGKTALAVEWAHRVASEFPDGQLHMNLRGYDPGQPAPPAEALAGFLAALGVPGPQIPPDLDGRAAAFRSALAGRRVLIVLDNAHDAEQVRPLLPGEPGCLVVVTSRDLLAGLVARDGARRVLLDVLPPVDAVALLRELIGMRADAEPQATARLADLCCCLPLALRVAAEVAAARPALSLTTLSDELDGQDRLDTLEAGGDQATAVRAVFSWSYGYLTADAAQTFRLLSLHPGADIDADAVAALAGTSNLEATEALAELARVSLIQQVVSGRYGMHDLLRSYAAELAAVQDPETSPREGMTRLLDHYLYAVHRAAHVLFPSDVPLPAGEPGGPTFSDEQQARTWLDAERANLVAVTAHASEHGWPGHAVGLSEALFRYLEAGGFLADAHVIHSAAARSAVQVADRAAEAGAAFRVGTIYGQLGRYPEAEQHFQRALGLSRGAGDRVIELRVLHNLSQVYFRTDAYSDAAASCQQALELSRATGNRISEARTMQVLAVIATRQGRYSQAAAVLLSAIEASRQADDRVFLVSSLMVLGEIEVMQGRYQQGRLHLEEAGVVARQIGHAVFEAEVTRFLGLADMREGRHEQAAQQLQQALALLHDVGLASSEAHALCYLGELDLRLARPEQAADNYRQALAIFRQISETAGEADALNGLGEAALAQGAPGESRVHHQSALAIAKSPEAQAHAHEGLGDLAAAKGDTAEARPHWQAALNLYVQMEWPEAERVRAKLTGTATTPSRQRPEQ